jgi:methionyl-tRNA formyltransferase
MERMNIIVSEKSWHQSMASDIGARLRCDFGLINSPESFSLETLQQKQPRYVFLPHWSHRISPEIFNSFECIIFHMTDLPFGRGGTPLQNLISRGFTETKISALKCTKEIDAGPIYLKRDLSLDGTAQEIYERASLIIEDMIYAIVKENITPAEQIGDPVVFERRKPEEGNLSGIKNIEDAYDLIRMLDADGYPHAFVEVGELIFRFTNADLNTNGLSANVQIVRRTVIDVEKSDQ